MITVTVSPNGEVLIPESVRERLDLHPGQQVQLIEYDDRLEFVPVRPMASMRGFLWGIDTNVPRE